MAENPETNATANSATIGVVKESVSGETRVGLIPDSVKHLTGKGLHVIVQAGAGEGSSISDSEYEVAGAHIVPSVADVHAAADVVVRVQPPAADRGELDGLQRDQVLVSYLAPLVNHDLNRQLAESGVTALAVDAVPRITRAQGMDALSAMSSIAGYKAAVLAAERLPRLFPLMMTAAGTIRPAKVLVLGAGVAGLQAIATARRLGAVVEAYDARPVVKEQVQSLGAKFVEIDTGASNAETAGGYAREATPEELRRQQEGLNDHIANADVVITTALVPGRPAPLLIPAVAVERMRHGSVIVDLAAETGGNCELTSPGEVTQEHGVTIVGTLNLPATLPVHASQMYAKVITNFLDLLIKDGEVNLNFDDEIIASMCITNRGEIVQAQTRKLMSLDESSEASVSATPAEAGIQSASSDETSSTAGLSGTAAELADESNAPTENVDGTGDTASTDDLSAQDGTTGDDVGFESDLTDASPTSGSSDETTGGDSDSGFASTSGGAPEGEYETDGTEISSFTAAEFVSTDEDDQSDTPDRDRSDVESGESAGHGADDFDATDDVTNDTTSSSDFTSGDQQSEDQEASSSGDFAIAGDHSGSNSGSDDSTGITSSGEGTGAANEVIHGDLAGSDSALDESADLTSPTENTGDYQTDASDTNVYVTGDLSAESEYSTEAPTDLTSPGDDTGDYPTDGDSLVADDGSEVLAGEGDGSVELSAETGSFEDGSHRDYSASAASSDSSGRDPVATDIAAISADGGSGGSESLGSESDLDGELFADDGSEKASDLVGETQGEAADEPPAAGTSGDGTRDTTSTRKQRRLPEHGEGTDWVAGDGTRSVPAGFPIKGNANSNLYHPQLSPSYETTVAEIYFASGEAAEAHGFRLPKGLQKLVDEDGSAVADDASEILMSDNASTSGYSSDNEPSASGFADDDSFGLTANDEPSTPGFSADDEVLTSGDAAYGSLELAADDETSAMAFGSPDADTNESAPSSENATTTGDAGSTRISTLPPDGEGIDWVAGDGTPAIQDGFPIKGNANSGIYHPLESSSYIHMIAEINFITGDVAEAYGYRLPKALQNAANAVGDSAASAAAQVNTGGNHAVVDAEEEFIDADKLKPFVREEEIASYETTESDGAVDEFLTWANTDSAPAGEDLHDASGENVEEENDKNE